MLIGLIAFLLVPVLIVYGANKPVDTDDSITFGGVGQANPDNAVTDDSITFGGQGIDSPLNPIPNDTISLGSLIYYDGSYHNGGGVYTPPTEVYNLMGFLFPLVLIIAGGGFVLALARNRPYRIVEMMKHV